MAESKRDAKKQIEFAIRYQPEAGTPDAILLEYIKDSRIVPSREMVFQALRAFWLPFAYDANSELTQEEQLQLVLEAVYALDKHADYLCSYFGAERPDFLQARGLFRHSNGNVPDEVSRRSQTRRARTDTPEVEQVPSLSYSYEEEYDPDSSFPDD